MSGTPNFDPAHQHFSRALAALANPYSAAFSDVRNSSVSSIKAIRQLTADQPAERLRESHERLRGAIAATRSLNAAVASISGCRNGIQSLLVQAPNAALEPHADIFVDSADESDKNEWDQMGSDDEIIG
jgi:hypothetical protein